MTRNPQDYSHKVAIVGASETETVGNLPDPLDAPAACGVGDARAR